MIFSYVTFVAANSRSSEIQQTVIVILGSYHEDITNEHLINVRTLSANRTEHMLNLINSLVLTVVGFTCKSNLELRIDNFEIEGLHL